MGDVALVVVDTALIIVGGVLFDVGDPDSVSCCRIKNGFESVAPVVHRTYLMVVGVGFRFCLTVDHHA